MANKKRHVPMRTCVVCGNKTSKRELKRIVAEPDGTVLIDETGKSAGRGAYVCGDGSCLDRGLRRGKLDHALRTKVSDEDWNGIQAVLGKLVAQD